MPKTSIGKHVFCKIVFFLNAFLLLASVAAHAAQDTDSAASETVLTLGKVTGNPLKQHQKLQPMADLLANRLSFTKGHSLFAKNILDMQKKMSSGEVDLFTGSAYEAAILIQSGAGEVIALKSKEGTKEYKSIIVVRQDSGIDSIQELKGKSIAFEDPDSTSAFRVPLIELKKAGLKLTESRDKPKSRNNSIAHYRFSGSEQNSSALLYRGAVDAIALSDIDWTKNKNVPEFQKKQFKIIHSSPSIPRAIEVASFSLTKEQRTMLQNIMLSLGEDESAFEALWSYHKTSEFTPISDEALIYLKELGNYFKK